MTKYRKGVNPNFELQYEYEILARDLAEFINNLHAIKLLDGPKSKRGLPYYRNTNPFLVALANRILDNVLGEGKWRL